MANEIIKQREVTDNILTRVSEMKDEGLGLPKNYNASNALNLAFLELVDMKVKGKPILEVVSKKSIQESLLNMVLQGLTPGKNQVYFIPYGNELQMQRSYFGTQAVLKRLSGVNDIWSNVIYDGDNFDIYIDDKGRERLKQHETSFLNKDNAILGAYAIIDTKEDGQMLTAMTKKQIDNSWSQARTTNVHKKFPEEMAKRTVINRAAKNYINTSDDSDMLIQAINQTTENEYDEDARRTDVTPEKAETVSKLEDKFKQKQQEKARPQEEPKNESEEARSIEVDYEEVTEEKEPVEEPKTEQVDEPSDNEDGEDSETIVQMEKDREEYLRSLEENEAPEEPKNSDVDWDKFTKEKISEALEKRNIPHNPRDKKEILVKTAETFLNRDKEEPKEEIKEESEPETGEMQGSLFQGNTISPNEEGDG